MFWKSSNAKIRKNRRTHNGHLKLLEIPLIFAMSSNLLNLLFMCICLICSPHIIWKATRVILCLKPSSVSRLRGLIIRLTLRDNLMKWGFGRTASSNVPVQFDSNLVWGITALWPRQVMLPIQIYYEGAVGQLILKFWIFFKASGQEWLWGLRSSSGSALRKRAKGHYLEFSHLIQRSALKPTTRFERKPIWRYQDKMLKLNFAPICPGLQEKCMVEAAS